MTVRTEKGWFGPIWPWDLDKLAIRFVTTRMAMDLSIDYHTWQNALTQFLDRSDCGCRAATCPPDCTLNMRGSAPPHFQALAHTLIGAETVRYVNILQRSPIMKHVINKEGTDRMWGSSGSKEDIIKGNYYYSPTKHTNECAKDSR